MNIPEIAIINFSSESDRDVQRAIRAVNRQVIEDFAPIWGSAYISQLHASRWGFTDDSDEQAEDPIRAAGVIYLVDESNLAGALGYHDMNASEVPYGFVFTDLGSGDEGDWSVTLSHEVLELIVDPTVNIFVPGPDPRNSDRWLFHTYEVCDAVERTTYLIDDVEVSNFVTPQYFREGDAPGTRNDFLGVGVPSFGLTDGSHLGVVDPVTFDWEIILGQAKSSKKSLHKRLVKLYRENTRSRLENDEKVAQSAMEKLQKCIDSATHPGTARMTGLTRGQRYQAASQKLRGIQAGEI